MSSSAAMTSVTLLYDRLLCNSVAQHVVGPVRFWWETRVAFSVGYTSLAVPSWCHFVPNLRKGLGSWTLCTRQGGQPEGIGQSPDKGLVVPLEKTQTWVSLRLKLPVPGLPRSHKGNVVCGSWREEEALRLPGNGPDHLASAHCQGNSCDL